MLLNLNKFALAALCLTFLLLNCTGHERDNPNDPGREGYYGSLIDSRDGQEYKTIAIGEQVWMAENLKYGGKEKYDYEAALTVCPSGWNLPGSSEWTTLLESNQTNIHGFLAVTKDDSLFYWGLDYWGNDYYYISMSNTGLNMITGYSDRTNLYSVRCLKNQICGDEEYNASTQGCENGVVLSKCRGGSLYNPTTHFCYGLDPYNKCGGLEYDINTHSCENGVLRPRCGSGLYDTLTQFCSAQDNKAYYKCGGLEYNTITQGCERDVVRQKCGLSLYNNTTQFCSEGKVYDMCGGLEYNTSTHLCDNGVVQTLPLCGTIYYNNATHFCSTQDSKVYDKCGNSEYNTTSHFCDKGVVQAMQQCGSAYYKNTIQFCSEQDGKVYDKCGGSDYNTKTQSCKNGTVLPICEMEAIFCDSQGNIILRDSRDEKMYRITAIGTQVWMAENLNYNANGSKCYNNTASYCKTYGYLYNLETAMLACPAGWHLPSGDEWDILMEYVQTDNGEDYTSGTNASIAGEHLKARNGWNSNGNGLDTYGFAALPGGFGNSGGSFLSAGSQGFWWSASEYSSYGSYHRNMFYGDENAGWNYGGKDYLYSVRCIQD
jgi:uncharacterized protein (TIGR02145 family)